ncbi:MAG: hypothetical protein J6Y97_09500 [Prevotella sp.]|nr:hypothetical protein [Prevotella sp.]
MNNLRLCLCGLLLSTVAMSANAVELSYKIALKKPGNAAVVHRLAERDGRLVADNNLPVTINKRTENVGEDKMLSITIEAKEQTYFNISISANTGFHTDDCDFYLPGFWYHKNLRSPKEAPSFHTAVSWNFREDRLYSPLTGVYDGKTGNTLTVMRMLDKQLADALLTHQEGEVILGGKSSVGFLGFDNEEGIAKLTFGYPFVETPKRYIRKLTLTPPVCAFAKLEKNEQITLKWFLHEGNTSDYGQFVADTWCYCYDRLKPQPLQPLYSPDEVKKQLSNYFRVAYVDKYPLKYHSGISIRCDDCKPVDHVQLGFCGRVLLNAFNALEYGEMTGDGTLVRIGQDIFDSWLRHGFTANGFFKEDMHIAGGIPEDKDIVHSIREQSEAVYAVLHYLNYERRHARVHKEWEERMKTLLDAMLRLQDEDGHFPRKYRDNFSEVDASGGSTPSATSTLVMGYKFFKNKDYLKAAKRTVDYLEKNIISQSDYFSSTLDANCEDKEAAISAVTATYYLAMVTKNKERSHYIDLCRKAAYFALSWYYLWDVPFAQGQMLGDLGFKSRGWSNVSVENNHIDVFVFELNHIVRWLSEVTEEKRFQSISDVISSSLCQLLPTENRLCGIGVPGFNPEVVQHTHWDYGKNGKGFYNDIFAPGWTIASLWELYSPRRTVDFLQ